MSFEAKSPSVKDLLKRFENPGNISTKNDVPSSVHNSKNDTDDRETSQRLLMIDTGDPDIIFKRKQVILELSNRKEGNANNRPFSCPPVAFQTSSSESKVEILSPDNQNKSHIEFVTTSKPPIEEEIEDTTVVNQSCDQKVAEIKETSFCNIQNSNNELSNIDQSFKRKRISCKNSKQSIYKFLNVVKCTITGFHDECMAFGSKIPLIVKFMVFEIEKSSAAAIACFFAVIVTMISSFYPTVPHCNVGLVSMLWMYVSIGQQSNKLVTLLSLAVFISFINDIIWLVSKSVLRPLDKLEETDLRMYELKQEASLNFKMAWYLLLLASLGKFGAWAAMLRQEDSGKKIMKQIWKKIFVFFPPGSMYLPESVYSIVESRIIAIVWLEFVSTSSLAILTLYSHTRLFWAEQFSTTIVVTSLINLLYTKAFCELLFLLSLLKNCSWVGVFSEFGCGRCLAMNPEENKVRINLGFFRFNWLVKACTFFPSCFLWISLESSFRMSGSDAPSVIRSTLSLITICLSLLDVYCVMLFIVTTCYSLAAKDQFPNWIEEGKMDENYDFNNNVPSSQDLFEMRLSSAETLRNSSSLHMDSTIECDDDQFQEYWQTFQYQAEFAYRISRIPSMNECHEVLATQSFYTVASGHIDANIYKIFFIGKSNTSLCLAQMTVNPAQRSISIILKTNTKNMIRKFTNNIPFHQLFGSMRHQHS